MGDSLGANPTLQTIATMRSVRDFKPDPVDDDKIRTVLEAAVRAPSSSNSQPWEFLVLRDAKVKRRVGEVVSARWHALMDAGMAKMPPDRRRIYDGATRLVDHTGTVPVVILACIDLNRASKSEEAKYGSIYPAVENLMLAAWSLGLGCCITTHGSSTARGEAEVKKVLGVPESIKVAAMIYMGYPSKKHRPPIRAAVDRVVHYDAW
ncbi:MAG TPA: nitroreductase family protein [Nitrososphaerales archaeon]|nr:nitroreductase family protein [Nitrososphaerales archaeon]